jgi:hypothetical protein
MVHLPVAGEPEQRKLPLERRYGEPGLAPVRIVRRVEDRRAMEDEEASGVEQQPDREGVALEDGREGVRISASSLGKARVIDDVLEGKPQLAPCEAFEFLPLQRRFRYTLRSPWLARRSAR